MAHKTEMRTKSRNTAEDKLAELQQKYALLEDDRKAHYEASQWTIKQNKETMLLAKSENKKLRNNLAKVRSAVSKGDPNEAEHRNLVGHARVLRKRYDECHTDVTKLSRELEKLRDNTKDLQRDAVRPTDEDSSEMRYIRLLENRLDKALVKYNEAHSIRKTYEQIVLKLREDRVSFDNQLGMIEKTLRDREVDLGELVLMSHDANHAREVAKLELHSIEDQVATERNLRTRELKERKQQMKAKKELHAKIRKREKEKYEAIQKESEMVYSDLKAAKQVKAKQKKQDEIMTAKVTTYQEAFQKIKEATGTSDMDELVKNFIVSEEQNFSLYNYLNDLSRESEKLDEQIEEIKFEIEKYKGQDEATEELHKKLVKEYDEKIAACREKTEKQEQNYQSVVRALSIMKNSIVSICNKTGCNAVIPKELLVEGVTEANILQYLAIVEQRATELSMMFMNSTAYAAISDNQGETRSQAQSQATSSLFNLQIDPPSTTADSKDESSDSEDDLDDRPLTRNELREKTAINLIKRNERAKKKKK